MSPDDSAAQSANASRLDATAGRAEKGLAVWVATAGGVGFGPWAPGTWGALGAVLLFLAGMDRLGMPLYLLVLLLASVIGTWSSTASEAYFGRHDDGRIVIDEVVGQWIALLPLVLLHDLPLGTFRVAGLQTFFESGIDLRWFLVVTAFVSFRWFDIRKPGPVQWAENRFRRGAGVMADDMVAGGLAAVVVTVPAFVIVAIRWREMVRDSLVALQDWVVYLGNGLA